MSLRHEAAMWAIKGQTVALDLADRTICKVFGHRWATSGPHRICERKGCGRFLYATAGKQRRMGWK